MGFLSKTAPFNLQITSLEAYSDFEYLDRYVVYEFLSFEVLIVRSVTGLLTSVELLGAAVATTKLEVKHPIITKIAIKLRHRVF